MFLISRASKNKMTSKNGVRQDEEEEVDPDTDPNEMLEYDLWEGQFSLSSPETETPNGDLELGTKVEFIGASTGVAKALKNARNQQKL